MDKVPIVLLLFEARAKETDGYQLTVMYIRNSIISYKDIMYLVTHETNIIARLSQQAFVVFLW